FHASCIDQWRRKYMKHGNSGNIRESHESFNNNNGRSFNVNSATSIDATLSWTCPNCRAPCSQAVCSQYTSLKQQHSIISSLCFSGKSDSTKGWTCGQICGKKLGKHCLHPYQTFHYCEKTCHQGSCSPCPYEKNVKCWQHQESRIIKCTFF